MAYYSTFKLSGEGRTGLQNTDYFSLKIPLYRRIFFKTLILNIFTTSQVFVCISRQPDLNSFKIHSRFATLAQLGFAVNSLFPMDSRPENIAEQRVMV